MAGLMATLSDPGILDRAPCDWIQVVRNLDHRLTVPVIVKEDGKNLPRQAFVVSQDAFAPEIAQALANSSLGALQVYGRLSTMPKPIGQ